jgi:hypothetical protein
MDQETSSKFRVITIDGQQKTYDSREEYINSRTLDIKNNENLQKLNIHFIPGLSTTQSYLPGFQSKN